MRIEIVLMCITVHCLFYGLPKPKTRSRLTWSVEVGVRASRARRRRRGRRRSDRGRRDPGVRDLLRLGARPRPPKRERQVRGGAMLQLNARGTNGRNDFKMIFNTLQTFPACYHRDSVSTPRASLR